MKNKHDVQCNLSALVRNQCCEIGYTVVKADIRPREMSVAANMMAPFNSGCKESQIYDGQFRCKLDCFKAACWVTICQHRTHQVILYRKSIMVCV